jgi:hypothetical protein
MDSEQLKYRNECIAAGHLKITVEEYRNKVSSGLVWCTSCKRWLDVSLFSSDKSRSSGVSCRCKSCASDRNKDWRARNKIKNPDYEKEQYRKKIDRNPNRSKEAWARFKEAHPTYSAKRREKRKELYPTYERDRTLSRYGMGEDDYNRMFESQGGRCLICHRLSPDEISEVRKDLAVDHTHTGDFKIRGLLCHRCNAGIGKADNMDVWDKAIAYLLFHKEAFNNVA